jgi:glycosyltransferase involved in cell wall biosynthesis
MTSIGASAHPGTAPSATSADPVDMTVTIAIPCLDEAQTIGKVVSDFQRQLPRASIVVGDNGSADGTGAVARRAGASVLVESRRGKGFVVQTLFQHIDSDIVILVDGDDTYPADDVHALLGPLLRGEADMVVGSRMLAGGASRFHPVNRLGNLLYRAVINSVFGTRLTDVLSGYRALSRTLVKDLPIFVRGFEVEAEITIKCLEREFRVAEVPVKLGARPEGSHSKIRIVRDGVRILTTILALFRDYKPLTFFGGLGLLTLLASSLTVLMTASMARSTGTLNIPLVTLATLLAVVGFLLMGVGLILHTIDRRFQELEYTMRVNR